LILPDLHVPEHDGRSLAAVEQFMADYRWDGIVNLGDFLDLSCISSHNIGKLRLVEGQRVQQEYALASQILDRHLDIIRAKNPNARYIWLMGNHEYRVDRFIDANPALEGLIEIPVALDLKRRGVEWIESWSKGHVFKLGKATFTHGKYTNDHHAKAHALKFGFDIHFGHLHDLCSSTVQPSMEEPSRHSHRGVYANPSLT
jgi:hypothetical protein